MTLRMRYLLVLPMWLLSVMCPALSSAQPFDTSVLKKNKVPPALSGTWNLDGDGSSGSLVLQEAVNGTLTGTMSSDTIVGYYAPGEHTVVMIRSNAQGAFQAYVGHVSADEQSIEGIFYDLSSASIGWDHNGFGFGATRAPAQPAVVPLVGFVRRHIAGSILERFGIHANNSDGVVTIDQIGAAGEIRGHVYDPDVLVGRFSSNGTIVFIRYHDGAPFQLFVGDATTWHELGLTGFEGEVYPLNSAAGASKSRMTFDWYNYFLVEICGNDTDEDRDGLSDANDRDCARPEVCNGIDDDLNGVIDDHRSCHTVELVFSNIDDTGRVWDKYDNVVCNIDSGDYPRMGRCDLSAYTAAHGGGDTFLVRFGNGGGGWSSGRVALEFDGQEVSSVGVDRVWNASYDWFFETHVQIDFARGTAVWH